MTVHYARRAAAALAMLGLFATAPPAHAQVTLDTAAEKAAYEARTPERAPAARLAAPPLTNDVGSVLVPRDGSFSIVQFDGPGGSGDANPADPDQRNDDDVTNAIPLGFSFDFYGTTYDEVYINNNGNVTFGGPLTTFTPFAFPSGTPIVAPFFADVDTRNPASGLVYVKSEPGRFTVLWEEVGYFNRQADERNTFQVVLTDGADPLVGAGNNVCLSYGDMNWTTGGASGGTNGFGGTAAIAGANAGDDASFFTVGRFDQAGDAYDGPAGAPDGVDYLDDRDVCFSTSDSETNVPPIAQGISDGDVVEIPYDPATRLIAGTIEFSFLSPEADQTTTISSFDFDSGDLIDDDDDVDADVRLTTTDGNPATGEIEVVLGPAISVDGGDAFDVTLEACDDGPDGGECTTVTITIRLDVFPTRDCEPGEWYMFPFTVTDGQEEVTVYASGPGSLDLSGCTFVAFDAFSEQVTLAVDVNQTLSAFEDRLLLKGGVDFPDGSLPDGPGAVAFIQGDVAVGDPVTSVAGRVAHAVVYFNNDEYFGVFPAGSPLDGSVRGARRAGGAGDLAAQLAAVRGSEAAEGPAFAVGPNPVRGAGTVAFRLEAEAEVRVAVYDVLGREVAVLADGTYAAGRHQATLDAGALPAGAYVVRLVAGGEAHAARVTVVR